MSEDWEWERWGGFDAEGYEQREACLALAECPRCGNDVELVAETESWTQDEKTGRWLHDCYGPAQGICCGVLLVDSWDGLRACKLSGGSDDSQGTEETQGGEDDPVSPPGQ